MNITSPDASFLNFNFTEQNSCNDEPDIALPVCDNVAIKAQINIESETLIPASEPIYVAICDADCNIVIDADNEVEPICNTYKFVTIIEEEQVDETSIFNLCNNEYKIPFREVTFETNPFNEINTTTFEFDFINYPTGWDEVQLQLYIQNKTYIIEWKPFIASEYEIKTANNVNYVKIKKYVSAVSSKNSLLNFFNNVIDVTHGTTTTQASSVYDYTVANMPSGSFVNNNLFINNLSTVLPSIYTGRFFYWDNLKIRYKALTKNNNIIEFVCSENFTSGYSYAIKYDYDTIYNNFAGNIVITNGIDPVIIVPFTVNDYSGTIYATFTAQSTTTYDIKLEITSTFNHSSGFNISKISMYNTLIYNITSCVTGDGYANIPLGNYSKQELIDLISSILGFTFDCNFTQCCDVLKFDFTADFGDSYGVTAQYILQPFWNKGYINFPPIPVCSPSYIYNLQYVSGIDFDFCSFTNVYFQDIYIEGDPTNYGNITIGNANELWFGIIGALGIEPIYDICNDIIVGNYYSEITFKVIVDEQEGTFIFKRTQLSDTCLDCFSYCILDSAKNVVACSNQFQVANDCCYVSKIEYWNNEDAFGFVYVNDIKNTIQLPFFLHSPKHLVKEKVYRQTDGTYKRLSADIEKEYECETDFFQEYLHDKLIVAFKHDNVIVTSNRLGITENVSQQGEYAMNWNSKIDFTAKAEFKLRTYFNGKNNNCGGNC